MGSQTPLDIKTWWTFRIFFIFSARGRGRKSPRRREGDRTIFYGKSHKGGGSLAGAGGEGVGGCLRGIPGGGAKYFFSGPKFPPRREIYCSVNYFRDSFLSAGVAKIFFVRDKKTRRVPPCAVKTCAVRPVFARVVGELRAADPSNLQGSVKQNASPGDNLRLRDQGGSRGRSRNQDQKTRTVSTCWSNPGGFSRYRPKGVFGKGAGNSQKCASETRQKRVRNASEMGLVLFGKEERRKCVRNPEKREKRSEKRSETCLKNV